ncbi:MAG: hypothetical protein ABR534_13050 [Desulfotignum sp.]|nr:hypothetical protein [Desulfobacteraceae bacterium]
MKEWVNFLYQKFGKARVFWLIHFNPWFAGLQSISSDDLEYFESKHLLRLLGELNDIEIIWLRFYLNPVLNGDNDFREKHSNILNPVGAHLGSAQPN